MIETTLFKRLSADGLDTEVLEPSDIDIVSSSQHDDLIALLGVLRIVGASFLGFAISVNLGPDQAIGTTAPAGNGHDRRLRPRVSLQRASARLHSSLAGATPLAPIRDALDRFLSLDLGLGFELLYENLPGDLGRVEPFTAAGGGLGEAIQAVAGQPLLSFVLLGDLAMSGSFFGGPGERLQGAAFEVAPDHGTAPLPPGTPNPTVPGLALHYHGRRGLPEEVAGLIGVRSDFIRGQGCDCVSAPDPNCVEGAADCPTTPLSCPR